MEERLKTFEEETRKNSLTLERLDGKIAVLAKSIEGFEKQLADYVELTRTIQELAVVVATYSQKVDHIVVQNEARLNLLESGQKSQGERIGSLESRPGKRWENLSTTIITTLTSTLIGVLIGYIVGR